MRRLVMLPLDAKGLKEEWPGGSLGSWELQGPSEEPVGSTTTSPV